MFDNHFYFIVSWATLNRWNDTYNGFSAMSLTPDVNSVQHILKHWRKLQNNRNMKFYVDCLHAAININLSVFVESPNQMMWMELFIVQQTTLVYTSVVLWYATTLIGWGYQLCMEQLPIHSICLLQIHSSMEKQKCVYRIWSNIEFIGEIKMDP